MPRKLFITLSVVGMLAAPTSAFACRPRPFDLHISQVTQALQAKTLDPAKRAEAERWLAAARGGKGPRWHGERQQALNKALVILSMPQATRAPLNELSPRQQEEQQRNEAQATLASVDVLMAKNKLSEAELAKVKQIREQVVKFIAAGKWAKASDTGTEALLKLGVSFPRC
jgi:hypothetical protein